MSKAAKRERQRQNREAARAVQQAAERRQRVMRSLRSFAILALVIVAGIAIFLVFSGSSKKSAASIKRSYSSAPKQTIDPSRTYTATIDTSEGTIVTALDAKAAPVATNNFVFLAQHKFYDGLTFHRVVKDFVIQGGDPKGDGSGSPGYSVKGEVPKDHYPIGALAAAKSGSDPDGTMGSQFFIVTGSQGATLPNQYARFGSVTSGIAVAQKIMSFAPSSGDGKPTTKVTIKKITIAESPATTPTT